MPRPGMELLERAAELQALEAALEHGGSLLALEGPAGAGKSSLLAAARERAEATGMVVLAARGAELERDLPFGVAIQLFSRPIAAVEPDQRERLLTGPAAPAAALFGIGDRHDPPQPDSTGAVLQALHRIVVAIARGGRDPDDGDRRPSGVLVAVDDLQWSDEPSLRFLLHLVLRLDELPVTVVVALRPGEADGAAAGLVDHVRLHERARRLVPQPLSAAAVAQLARAAFPGAAEAFTAACARATGGNPFLVRELLESLRADRVAPDARTAAEVGRLVPESVVRSVLLRLGRLPDSAARLAAAVAVLGDGCSLAHAATLAGLGDDAAERAADALSGAQLLVGGEPLAFTHPLIAAAVEADLPPFARARAHRDAAELLAGAGAPGEVVGAHLLASRPRGDAWVVATLRAAAERALAGGDPRTATRLLARALEEPPAAEQRDAVVVEHALAEASAGLPGADERLAAALQLIDVPRRRGEALLGLSRLLAARADFAGAARAAERALEELGADDPLAGKALAVALDAASRQSGRRAEALERFAALAESPAAAAVAGDPALQARLASRLASRGDPAERPRALELAEAALAASPLVDPDFHGAPLAFAAGALYWAGELERCRSASAAALDAAHARGSTIALACATYWHAAACHQLGRLQEAAASARLGIELARDGWTALLGWTAPLLALIEVERGDLDAARAALEAGAHTDPDLLEHAHALEARGRVALAEDDGAGALECFEAAGRHLRERYRIDNPAVLGWRSQAALAAARLGDDERARATALAAEEVEAARRLGLPRPLGQALRVAGLLAGGERGLALLSEAVDVLEHAPSALARAHALVDYGAALRRAGRRQAARDPLRRGLALAERIGAAPLERRAGEELRASGGRRGRPHELSGVDALTPTESRIARLAADGLTNPQIARRLYVTTKTVEWHLANVFRKLDVGSRRQLAAALPAGDEPAPA